MISDGGSSTYPTIAAEKPYGHNHLVKKMECVGHVKKRMYAHLKALKSRQNKDADGKVVRMEGKGRCGDEASEILWQGRSNVGDAKSMQDAVMAILPLFIH